jgi:Protein CHAPERONE-LIKE PROTEIN OF POR1-like
MMQIIVLFLSVTSTAGFASNVVQLTASAHSTTSALHAATTIPNPFKKLPWVAEKERQREARRMKMERAKLHRELGIVEDATYEEIVKATDNLIAAAGKDIKQKIRIEVAKDKILQIRLNERLAGLNTATTYARAQSDFEREGYALC